MPGRLRTASRPSSTWMAEASYAVPSATADEDRPGVVVRASRVGSTAPMAASPASVALLASEASVAAADSACCGVPSGAVSGVSMLLSSGVLGTVLLQLVWLMPRARGGYCALGATFTVRSLPVSACQRTPLEAREAGFFDISHLFPTRHTAPTPLRRSGAFFGLAAALHRGSSHLASPRPSGEVRGTHFPRGSLGQPEGERGASAAGGEEGPGAVLGDADAVAGVAAVLRPASAPPGCRVTRPGVDDDAPTRCRSRRTPPRRPWAGSCRRRSRSAAAEQDGERRVVLRRVLA